MTDAGHRVPDPPHHEFVMPAMTGMEILTVQLPARTLRNFQSVLPVATDTFAFVVRTELPIPIRALGPVLYVGKSAITEVTEIGPNTYRFVTDTPRDFERGAPIHLGWSGQPPAERQSSRFRFEP